MPNPPNAITGLLVELGRPMTVMIGVVTCIAIVVLLRASLRRGRDSFYPALGAGCLMALLIRAFADAEIFAQSVSIIAAGTIGLALAQSTGRTIR